MTVRNKRKYLEVEFLFRGDKTSEIEELGIGEIDHSIFDPTEGILFLDEIYAINESAYKGVTTVHTSGGGFLVKGEYPFIKHLILSEYENDEG